MKKKDFDKRNSYAIRKLTVGAASVLIGTTILLGGKNVDVVHAAEKDGNESPSTEQVLPTSDDANSQKITPSTKIEVHPSNTGAKLDEQQEKIPNPQGKDTATPADKTNANGSETVSEVNDNKTVDKGNTTPVAAKATADSGTPSPAKTPSDGKNTPEAKSQDSASKGGPEEESETPEKSPVPKAAPDQTESSLKGTAQQYTEGETPELNPSVLNPDDLRKLGLNADDLGSDTKLVWTKAPDVSKVGSTIGTAELTYTDYSAQPDASGHYPVKHIDVNIPVNVREGQVKKAGQVRNSITYVDEDDNSVVRQYSWVGDKDTQNNGLTEDASAQLESLVTRLGFTVDDEKGDGDQGLDKLIHFGDSDQNLVVYVHELSRQPILLDQNYNVGNYNRQAVVDKNGKVIADPAAVIGNLGDLPYGTTVSWAVAPKYDLTIDPDASNSTTGTVYKNELPINTPVVKVVLPGQKPVYLQLSRPEDKQLVSLPQEGTAMAPVWQAQIEAPIGSTINPRNLITNYDELLNSAFAQTGLPESEKAAYAKYFQDAFSWDVAPDLSQVGDTFGHVIVKPSSEFGPNYLDGSQYMTVLVHVVPRTWTNNNKVTRTIEVVDPTTGKTTITKQKVIFIRNGEQEIVGGPINYGDWKNPTGIWPEFKAPIYDAKTNQNLDFKGYKPSQSEVEQVTVHPGDSDQTVKITYAKINSDNTNSGGSSTNKPQPKPTPEPAPQTSIVTPVTPAPVHPEVNPTPTPQPSPTPVQPTVAPVHPESTPQPTTSAQPTSANKVETVRPHAYKAAAPVKKQAKKNAPVVKNVAPKSEIVKSKAPKKAAASSELKNAKVRAGKPEIKQTASKNAPAKKSAPVTSKQGNKQEKVALPQTGEKQDHLTEAGAIGLGTAAMIGLFDLAGDRKRKNN